MTLEAVVRLFLCVGVLLLLLLQLVLIVNDARFRADQVGRCLLSAPSPHGL